MGLGLSIFHFFATIFLGGGLVMKKSENLGLGGVYFGPLENGGGVLGGSEKWGECTRLREKMGGVRI